MLVLLVILAVAITVVILLRHPYTPGTTKTVTLSTSKASSSLATPMPLVQLCEAHQIGGADVKCQGSCKFTLVESIPINLTYPSGSPSFPSTFSAWQTLINRANQSIDIAAFYWTLRGSDGYSDPSDYEGEAAFKLLMQKSKSVPVRIAQNVASKSFPQLDTQALANASKLVTVRSLNMPHWFGSGVLHTKIWVVDNKHFYVGSANLDWRSLTQVKEMGVLVQDCPCMGADIANIFAVYWAMGKPNATLPSHWPANCTAKYNATTPHVVQLGSIPSAVYFSSSPPGFCPTNRVDDLTAILGVINSAQKFIHIAVMDYFPVTLYMKHNTYWPYIDDALRAAAYNRGVQVRLLASKWRYTKHTMYSFLNSLEYINKTLDYKPGSIAIKLFEVPASPAQSKIPFARVNHNKYMVTESTAYIGTIMQCLAQKVQRRGFPQSPVDNTSE